MGTHYMADLTSWISNELRGHRKAMVDFDDWLYDRGYAYRTGRKYLMVAGQLGEWLARHGISLRQATRNDVKRFLMEYQPSIHRSRISRPEDRKSVHAGAINYLKFIQNCDLASLGHKVTKHDRHLDKYRKHLADCVGLANSTIKAKLRYTGHFLKTMFKDEKIKMARISPKMLIDYISERATMLGSETVRNLTGSFQSYFRFLRLHGYHVEHLLHAIPKISHAKGNRIPRIMTKQQVARFIQAFDRTTAIGKRDYAMAVSMLDLALRSSDVAAIQIQDIDWSAGVLHIRNVKTRAPYKLPMLRRVGKALADYLEHGRPRTESHYLFLSHRAPIRDGISTYVVAGAMRFAYARAGLPASWGGAHILRHTAAARLQANGTPLKGISDILGHTDPESAMAYMQVNVSQLAIVALDWPEGLR